MKIVRKYLFLLLSLYGIQQGVAQEINLLPQPVSLHQQAGVFILSPQVTIVYQRDKSELRDIALSLQQRIARPTGMQLSLRYSKDNKISRYILLKLNDQADSRLGKEGYTLNVTNQEVSLSANEPAGLFYGMQTLMQLLPAAIESKTIAKELKWSLPCVTILDYPRFGWRGLMLDVSRHFFPKEDVKRYIDQMAKYKFNVFHWHLTDDQGWRIEIKSFPKLTSTGAWRVPRTGTWWQFDEPQPGEPATDGGYYTQEDIREVVQYAQDRHIMIIPEIDVPGHSMAALAAYPEYSCTGGPFNVNPGSKFQGENSLCAGNDSTFVFLDKVIGEVADLFPSPYIHMGGDECNKAFWKKCPKCQQRMLTEKLNSAEELQSYFVRRVEQIILSKGKKLIGWDEILEGGLAPSATVMSWRGMEGGITAAKAGHQIIMTPTQYCYLDLYQGDPVTEPETYSMLRLKTCYEFDPVPEGIDAALVLGGQGNLWTESVPTLRHAEYMTWPRSFALAEVFWSPKEMRDWPGFVKRAEAQTRRYDAARVNYATSLYDPAFKAVQETENGLLITLSTEVPGLITYYTFDNTRPDNFSAKYEQPLHVPKNARNLKVITYRNGELVGHEISMPIAELLKRAGEKK